MRFRAITILSLFLACVFLFSGCADLRDKFIRKKKEVSPVMQYTSVKTYDVKPSLELYTTRYIYWKSWHSELLKVLTHSNRKKARTAVDQEISSMRDMQRMLVDKKAEALGVQIEKMLEVQKILAASSITQGTFVRVRRQIETVGRAVKRDFSYTKVKGSLLHEFRTSL